MAKTDTSERTWVDEDTEFAPGWNPSPGDMIEGVIVTKDIGFNDNYPERRVLKSLENGEYPIVTIEQAGGERVAVHCFQTILARVLYRKEIGDEIRVTYLGTEAQENGRKLAQYRFAHPVPLDRPF